MICPKCKKVIGLFSNLKTPINRDNLGFRCPHCGSSLEITNKVSIALLGYAALALFYPLILLVNYFIGASDRLLEYVIFLVLLYLFFVYIWFKNRFNKYVVLRDAGQIYKNRNKSSYFGPLSRRLVFVIISIVSVSYFSSAYLKTGNNNYLIFLPGDVAEVLLGTNESRDDIEKNFEDILIHKRDYLADNIIMMRAYPDNQDIAFERLKTRLAKLNLDSIEEIDFDFFTYKKIGEEFELCVILKNDIDCVKSKNGKVYSVGYLCREECKHLKLNNCQECISYDQCFAHCIK